MTDLYPYMLPTLDSVAIAKCGRVGVRMQHTVDDVCFLPQISTMHSIFKTCSFFFLQISTMLDKGDLLSVVREIEMASLSDLVRHQQSVVRTFVLTLNSAIPLQLTEAALNLWNKLESVVPRMLYEVTCFCV